MPKAPDPLRVVVQDRRRLLREGLASLLAGEPGIVVIAAVESATDLAVIAQRADAVICPGPIPFLPGCTVRVVRLTDEAPDALAELLRDENAKPELSDLRLTPRESEIMRGVADGLSTGRIGALLGISPKTVENHKQRIFTKLGVQSQTHAVVVAHSAGLLPRVVGYP